MSITFRKAVRENVGWIIGIAGPSGSGKTFSAMRLAAGMSGGKPFAVIDTEAGRAKHYADRFAFDHADLQPPFRPEAYSDAIKVADDANYPVIIVDSFSHEHAGEGGLLDWHEDELERMAGQDWQRRESCKMAAWIKPKTSHKRLVSRLLQVRAHLILCFRAEQKIEIVKHNGKSEIQPKRIASGFSDWIPICEKNILYELTASFLLTPEHPGIPKPIKLEAQHRDIVSLTNPLDEQEGRKLAEWAKGTVEEAAIDKGPIHASTHGLMRDRFKPETPVITPPFQDDTTILFNDVAVEIQKAETSKQASDLYWQAVRAGDLPKLKLDALKVVMQERLSQLTKKK